MLKDVINAGETNNVEFKRELPSDHKKYLKTVVAFANGTGGKIIFGVEDDTLNVTGIDENEIFKAQSQFLLINQCSY